MCDMLNLIYRKKNEALHRQTVCPCSPVGKRLDACHQFNGFVESTERAQLATELAEGATHGSKSCAHHSFCTAGSGVRTAEDAGDRASKRMIGRTPRRNQDSHGFKQLFSLDKYRFPPGFHTTTRELQTRTLKGSGASNTTKIPREDTQRERKKKRKWGREREKKREILSPRAPPFWAPPCGAPPFGPPPFGPPLFLGLGPHPAGPHPSGPHFF